MSVFTSLGILILAMLIIVSMKLIPGIFALFYHYASGKFNHKRVGDLAIFFILGVETLPILLFVLINFVTQIFILTDTAPNETLVSWITAGLLAALGFAYFFFYFQRGRGSKLFISRKTSKNFLHHTKIVKSRSNAFALGFTAGIPELIFTLPLYILIFIDATKNYLTTSTCSLILAGFVLLTISPLFFLYAYFKTNHNLADYMKKRFKNKSFFRLFVTSLYLILAISTIIFGVIL